MWEKIQTYAEDKLGASPLIWASIVVVSLWIYEIIERQKLKGK